MKRVSVEVAKYLKKIGYPIEVKSIEEAEKLGWKKNEVFFTGMCTCALCPYVMEVWLWLWREKGKVIEPTHCTEGWTIPIIGVNGFYLDQEEAIIAAIEYLVTNKLLK